MNALFCPPAIRALFPHSGTPSRPWIWLHLVLRIVPLALFLGFSLRAHGATTYSITVSANPAAEGTVSGGGTVNSGQPVTVTATPTPGYMFANWTENATVVSTTASYSFTAQANRTLVANFWLPVTTFVSADPVAGGTVAGGGAVDRGQSVTVTATPSSGYTFANWTVGIPDGASVSLQPSYTFKAFNDRTLVANFNRVPATYTIAVSAAQPIGGTVAGGGSFTSGQYVTVTATAKSGFSFANWTDAGTIVSANASYSFNVNANRTLMANFSASLVLDAVPQVAGTVAGGGQVPAGQNATVTATAKPGYTFVNWTEGVPSVEGNPVVSTAASYSFTANSSKFLAANFKSAAGGFSVRTTSRTEVQDFYDIYRASEGVHLNATTLTDTSKCVAGVNSLAYREAVLRRINWFRAMAGVPASVTFDDTFNAKAQQAVLILARGGYTIGDPHHLLPDAPCYNADGAEAALNSNITVGEDGPMAVSGYIDDSGSNNAEAPHRRWVLLPQSLTMGTGDIRNAANALWVITGGRDPKPVKRNPYVCWPPPDYVPGSSAEFVGNFWLIVG